jgi:hypothetical protein
MIIEIHKHIRLIEKKNIRIFFLFKAAHIRNIIQK